MLCFFRTTFCYSVWVLISPIRLQSFSSGFCLPGWSWCRPSGRILAVLRGGLFCRGSNPRLGPAGYLKVMRNTIFSLLWSNKANFHSSLKPFSCSIKKTFVVQVHSEWMRTQHLTNVFITTLLELPYWFKTTLETWNPCNEMIIFQTLTSFCFIRE